MRQISNKLPGLSCFSLFDVSQTVHYYDASLHLCSGILFPSFLEEKVAQPKVTIDICPFIFASKHFLTLFRLFMGGFPIIVFYPLLPTKVVMAFHENGRSDTGGMLISLPQWVLEIGKDNQDIFFTGCQGRRNRECLSWGIDKERVLRGRTAIEV